MDGQTRQIEGMPINSSIYDTADACIDTGSLLLHEGNDNLFTQTEIKIGRLSRA